jgi:hypothetical protein
MCILKMKFKGSVSYSDTGSEYNGEMYEILFYSRIVTQPERDYITSYLWNKWFVSPNITTGNSFSQKSLTIQMPTQQAHLALQAQLQSLAVEQLQQLEHLAVALQTLHLLLFQIPLLQVLLLQLIRTVNLLHPRTTDYFLRFWLECLWGSVALSFS